MLIAQLPWDSHLRGRLKDSFCHVATYARHVNLGFNRGAGLPDPQRVLQGTGKSIRHIRITQEGDLAAPYLTRYIEAAIAQVGGQPEKGGGGVWQLPAAQIPQA